MNSFDCRVRRAGGVRGGVSGRSVEQEVLEEVLVSPLEEEVWQPAGAS